MPSSTILLAVIVSLTLGYIIMLKIEISDLRDIQSELRSELTITKSQVSTFKSSIASTNKIIEAQKLNIDAKEKELKEWKSKPTKVKYETIYRDVVKDTNLTGECDEVKDLINSVSTINLNTI